MRYLYALLCLALSVMSSGHGAYAQFSFTPSTTGYYQNFNVFAGQPGSEPPHWTIEPASITYRGEGCGTNNAGGVYGYRFAGSGDYAMGYVASTSADSVWFTVQFVNNTGAMITELDVSYFFETWRRLSVGRTNSFTISTDIPGANAAQLAQLHHFQAPEPYVVGDDTICNDQLRVFKWARLTGLNIANGAGFYIRWASGRGSGAVSAHGIAIDDVVVRIPCKSFSTVDTTLCWNDTFITSDNRIYTSSQLVYDTLLNAA